MKLKLILSSILFLVSLTMKPQSRADSLLKLTENDREDTAKAVHLARLAYEIRSTDPEKCCTYARQALALAQKREYVFGTGLANLALGTGNLYLSKFPEALGQLSAAARDLAAAGAKKDLARARNNMGTIYWFQGNYPEALKTYFSVLQVMEEMHDLAGMASAYNNVANVYYNQEDYPSALKNYEASLQLRKQMGDRDEEGWSYNNIGEIYRSTNDFKKAQENFERALGLFASVDNKRGMSDAGTNLGIVFKGQGFYEKAFERFTEALKLREENGDADGVANSYINLGILFGAQSNFTQADSAFNRALRTALAVGNKDAIKDCYLQLSVLDSARGDFKHALEHYSEYIACRDSLMNEANTRKTVQAQMQYEFGKKEAATRADQEKKDAVAAAEKRRQKIILWSISAFGLLVLGFAVFAYRSFLQKKKVNAEISLQKHLIEEKQKEILDSIYYARRIQRSLLPNEKIIEKYMRRSK